VKVAIADLMLKKRSWPSPAQTPQIAKNMAN
jgi:hypothetical protein